MKLIPGGKYRIGGNEQQGFITDCENQSVTVTISDFYMSQATVTNAQFMKFVEATGYQTEAQKLGSSFVFHLLAQEGNHQPVDGSPWWLDVQGADWQHPFGPNSSIDRLMDHPVVHVSHNDAVAYCRWAGHRLPTEAEWEIAAKGGSDHMLFPWGDLATDPDPTLCNTWQGNFPYENTLQDGYLGTAPITAYPPNSYGLYQMIGNVWEWCANPARIDMEYFVHLDGPGFWATIHDPSNKSYALKGGSFLCHNSYCRRYRIAARNGKPALTAASNIGFRTVKEGGNHHENSDH